MFGHQCDMSFQDALDRMPQKGAMLLIEEVLGADEGTIFCRARDHRGADYPLRVSGQLMTISLVELGAQAAAAHASLFGVGGHHAGLILALRDVDVKETDANRFESPLETNAERLHFDESGARYRFSVRCGATEILDGEALLMMHAVEA